MDLCSFIQAGLVAANGAEGPTRAENLSEGLVLMLTGIIVVLALLIVLMALIYLISRIERMFAGGDIESGKSNITSGEIQGMAANGAVSAEGAIPAHVAAAIGLALHQHFQEEEENRLVVCFDPPGPCAWSGQCRTDMMAARQATIRRERG